MEKGAQSEESDARFAAVLNLAEVGGMEESLPAAKDSDTTIRREVAEVFADKMYVPGLAALLNDQDEQIRQIAKSALQPASGEKGDFIRAVCVLRDALDSNEIKALAASQLILLGAEPSKKESTELKAWAEQATGGLAPGVHVQYFKEPGQPPVAEKVLHIVDLGFFAVSQRQKLQI